MALQMLILMLSIESYYPDWLVEKNAVEDFHWLYFAFLCWTLRLGFILIFNHFPEFYVKMGFLAIFWNSENF